MKHITAMLFVLPLVLLAGCGDSDKTVTLRFRHDPGTQLSYRQDTDQRAVVIEHDSVTQRMNTHVVATVDETVRRVLPDSTAEVAQAIIFTYPKQREGDSSKIDTVTESKQLTLYVTPLGKIVDIQFPDSTDPADAEFQRQFFQQGYPVFPEEPVRKGSTWTQTVDVKLPDTTVQASTVYTVDDFGNDGGYAVVDIDYEGHLILPRLESPKDTLRRSGLDHMQIKGTMKFAYDDGLVVSQKDTWTVNAERKKFVTGNWVNYSAKVDMDIDYRLVGKKTLPRP